MRKHPYYIKNKQCSCFILLSLLLGHAHDNPKLWRKRRCCFSVLRVFSSQQLSLPYKSELKITIFIYPELLAYDLWYTTRLSSIFMIITRKITNLNHMTVNDTRIWKGVEAKLWIKYENWGAVDPLNSPNSVI